jgi:hypothetical protein
MSGPEPQGVKEMAETKQTSIIQFEPQTIGEAIEVSTKLAASTLLPPDLQKQPANVLVQVLAGRERGLGMMQSIAGFHVIKGKPVMSSEMMAALVKRSPECEYLQLLETSEESATYETKRKGDPKPTRMSYTAAEAKRAGTYKADSGWAKAPAAMCRARAVAALCRVVYPDLLLGICEESEAEEIKARDRAEQVERAAAAVRGEGPVVEAEVVRTETAESAPDFDRVKMAERIFATKTIEELRAMQPELKAAPESEKPALRDTYNARMAELMKPAAQVVEAEVAPEPAA